MEFAISLFLRFSIVQYVMRYTKHNGKLDNSPKKNYPKSNSNKLSILVVVVDALERKKLRVLEQRNEVWHRVKLIFSVLY